MELYRWALLKDEQSVHQIAAERRVWIQVVKGNVTINGVKASTSDGLAIWDEQAISIHADSGWRSVTVRSAAGLKLNGIFEACLFAGFLARSGRVLMYASGVLPRR